MNCDKWWQSWSVTCYIMSPSAMDTDHTVDSGCCEALGLGVDKVEKSLINQ